MKFFFPLRFEENKSELFLVWDFKEIELLRRLMAPQNGDKNKSKIRNKIFFSRFYERI